MTKFYVITWEGMPCRESGHVIGSWHSDDVEMIINQTAVFLHELDAWNVINSATFKKEWGFAIKDFNVMEL